MSGIFSEPSSPVLARRNTMRTLRSRSMQFFGFHLNEALDEKVPDIGKRSSKVLSKSTSSLRSSHDEQEETERKLLVDVGQDDLLLHDMKQAQEHFKSLLANQLHDHMISFKLSRDGTTVSNTSKKERFILLRGNSMAADFVDVVLKEKKDKETLPMVQGFLFDMAYLLGAVEATHFMRTASITLTELQSICYGLILLSPMGLATNVKLECCTLDSRILIKFNTPSSFEAKSWQKFPSHQHKCCCILPAFLAGWTATISNATDLMVTELEVAIHYQLIV